VLKNNQPGLVPSSKGSISLSTNQKKNSNDISFRNYNDATLRANRDSILHDDLPDRTTPEMQIT